MEKAQVHEHLSELSQADHLLRVREHAQTLAETLRDAADAGVSNALILPQLVLVFREAFGEMPSGMPTIPGMDGILPGVPA